MLDQVRLHLLIYIQHIQNVPFSGDIGQAAR